MSDNELYNLREKWLWALRDARERGLPLPPPETRITLLDFVTRFPNIRVSAHRQASDIGVTERTVQRHRKILEETGWVKCFPGFGLGYPSVYLLTVPPHDTGDTERTTLMTDASDTRVVQRKQEVTKKETNDEGGQGLTPLSLPGGRSAGDAPAEQEKNEGEDDLGIYRIEGEIINLKENDVVNSIKYGEGVVVMVLTWGHRVAVDFGDVSVWFKREDEGFPWRFLAEVG
jgi:hypothetical protein